MPSYRGWGVFLHPPGPLGGEKDVDADEARVGGESVAERVEFAAGELSVDLRPAAL